MLKIVTLDLQFKVASKPFYFDPRLKGKLRFMGRIFNYDYNFVDKFFYVLIDIGFKLKIAYYYLSFFYKFPFRNPLYRLYFWEDFKFLLYGSYNSALVFFSKFTLGYFPFSFFNAVFFNSSFDKRFYNAKSIGFLYHSLYRRVKDLLFDLDVHISFFFANWCIAFPKATAFTFFFKYSGAMVFLGSKKFDLSVYTNSFDGLNFEFNEFMIRKYQQNYFVGFLSSLKVFFFFKLFMLPQILIGDVLLSFLEFFLDFFMMAFSYFFLLRFFFRFFIFFCFFLVSYHGFWLWFSVFLFEILFFFKRIDFFNEPRAYRLFAVSALARIFAQGLFQEFYVNVNHVAFVTKFNAVCFNFSRQGQVPRYTDLVFFKGLGFPFRSCFIASYRCLVFKLSFSCDAKSMATKANNNGRLNFKKWNEKKRFVKGYAARLRSKRTLNLSLSLRHSFNSFFFRHFNFTPQSFKIKTLYNSFFFACHRLGLSGKLLYIMGKVNLINFLNSYVFIYSGKGYFRGLKGKVSTNSTSLRLLNEVTRFYKRLLKSLFFFYEKARRYRLWGYNKLLLKSKKEGRFFSKRRPQSYYNVGLMCETSSTLLSSYNNSVMDYSLAFCTKSKKKRGFLNNRREYFFISCSSLVLLVFFFNLNFGFYKGLFSRGFCISFERLAFSKILKLLYKRLSFKRLSRRFFFNFCVRRLRARLASCYDRAAAPKNVSKKGLFLFNNLPRGAYFFNFIFSYFVFPFRAHISYNFFGGYLFLLVNLFFYFLDFFWSYNSAYIFFNAKKINVALAIRFAFTYRFFLWFKVFFRLFKNFVSYLFVLIVYFYSGSQGFYAENIKFIFSPFYSCYYVFIVSFFSKFFFLRANKAVKVKYSSGSVLGKERALRRFKGRKFFFIRRLHSFERKLYATMQKYYSLRFAGFLRNAFKIKFKISKTKLRRSSIFKRIFFKRFFFPARKKQWNFYRNSYKRKMVSIKNVKVNESILEEVLHKPVVSTKTSFVFVLDFTRILLFFYSD